MGEATTILRTSIHTFLQNYTSLISVAVLLSLPFSSSLLLSQSLPSLSPSSFLLISLHLRSLFLAANFPPSTLLNPILSQSLISSILTLPFTLTFLIFAKLSITRIILHRQNSNIYFPLLKTHIFNSFIFLSTKAIFILLFILFIVGDLISILSKTSLIAMFIVGAILYSIAIASIVVISNMAVVVSAMESWRGYVHVLIMAGTLIKGKVATALIITVVMNVAMAAIEALFQYRVLRRYKLSMGLDVSMVYEGLMIAYMHSLLVVLEIVSSCVFYKKCRLNCLVEGGFRYGDYGVEFEPENKCEV